MSKASEHAVLWCDTHLPQLKAGNIEPEDVVANVMHWCEANSADNPIARAEMHYESERGDGDDMANDPYLDDEIAKLKETA